jgi:hypothetical protein
MCHVSPDIDHAADYNHAKCKDCGQHSCPGAQSHIYACLNMKHRTHVQTAQNLLSLEDG